MKRTLLTATLLLAGLTLQAQERLSRDEARRYADWVGSVQKQIQFPTLTVVPDLQKPVALRDGEYGGMVIPDATLTAEALAKAGEKAVPVGQLWLLKLAPLVEGSVVGRERLRLLTVNGDGGSATVPCCLLGVRRTSAGLELVAFGKTDEPLFKAPLKSVTAKQEYPLDLEADRTGEGADLTLRILGKYEARFKVTDPDLY